MAQGLNGSDLQVHPVLAVEDLGALLRFSISRAAVAVDTSAETSEANRKVDGSQIGLLRGRGRGGGLGGLGCSLRGVLADALKQDD